MRFAEYESEAPPIDAVAMTARISKCRFTEAAGMEPDEVILTSFFWGGRGDTKLAGVGRNKDVLNAGMDAIIQQK